MSSLSPKLDCSSRRVNWPLNSCIKAQRPGGWNTRYRSVLLRGTIVNRTYGTHENLCISLFLPTIFGHTRYLLWPRVIISGPFGCRKWTVSDIFILFVECLLAIFLSHSETESCRLLSPANRCERGSLSSVVGWCRKMSELHPFPFFSGLDGYCITTIRYSQYVRIPV